MPPPRKNPPSNAAETIRNLATRGFSLVGIASQMGVSKDLLNKWFERFPLLENAFELGKDSQRQALHEMLYNKALAKGDTLAALSILNSLHGWRDPRKGGASVDVNVDVQVRNVMIVTDHGSDSEWAAKAAAQQKNLVLNATSDLRPLKILDAPKAESVQIVPETPPIPTWMPPQTPPVQRQAKGPTPQTIEAPVWRANG